MNAPAQPLTARGKAKAARRAELLAAAARLMAERGFAGVRLEDIGAAVGVRGPAMYRHFEGKEDVLAQLLVGISEELHEGGRAVAAAAPDAETALRDLISFHVDFAVAKPDLIRVQDRDLSSLGAVPRRTVRLLQRRYVEIWVDVLVRARGFPVTGARARVHATIGLINSVPRLPSGDPSALLRAMAAAAITAPSGRAAPAARSASPPEPGFPARPGPSDRKVTPMNWDDYDAALFDLDGVLTPTAEVHMRAWDRLFNEYLAELGGHQPYTEADYFDYVDGKPRYDGVRSFLASRGITLPEGTPDDAADAETVCGLGNRKNAVFTAVLAADGVEPYPASVRLLDFLAARGTKVAVVSSSRNAPGVLAASGLADRFEIVIDGQVAAAEGIAGKPAPDTYLVAAERLGVGRERAVVFEDATSGVAAGHAGRFGLVVGVDRGAGADALTESGADVVVAELDELC